MNLQKIDRVFVGILIVLIGNLTFSPPMNAAEPAQKVGKTFPTASELLKSMDHNLQYESRSTTTVMTVNNGRRVLIYEMKSFARGESDAAIEYVSPEREKGTRMLKKGENLWIYLPRAERVQKISGHMLRQGMMGSDISYEDMMAASDFEESYSATVTGEESVDGRAHWRLEAVAKDASIAYPKRIIWIDQANLIPSKQELFALSGMKLKTWTMTNIKVIDGKNIPLTMVIQDHLQEGSKTTIEIKEIILGVELKDEVFSTRWLERQK